MTEDRRCRHCGQPLAPGASFCRSCGARRQPASDSRRGGVAIWAGLVIVLLGAVTGLAILLLSDQGSSRTTVVVDEETAGREEVTTTVESGSESVATGVTAGLYLQAGSFRLVANAEAEQERLAAAGVKVDVISSDDARELYPGFQVLLAGPFNSASEEQRTLKALHRNGVPSAYARPLSPASGIEDPAQIAGNWSGVLDRTSGERPRLDDEFEVTLEIASDGRAGTLVFETEGCSEELTLTEVGPTTLAYAQDSDCVADADLLIRPAGTEVMISVIPLDTDVLVTGTLDSL